MSKYISPNGRITFEWDSKNERLEIHGDSEGLKSLAKILEALALKKAVAREGDLRPALPPAGSVRTAYGIELRGLPVPSWGWVQGGKVKHDETTQRRLFFVVSVVAACFKFVLKSLSCRQKHGFAIVRDQ